jgi:hypothetical protein
VVFYLLARLAGCSVGPGISCGARKLTRTPWIKKKKKESSEKIRLNFSKCEKKNDMGKNEIGFRKNFE